MSKPLNKAPQCLQRPLLRLQRYDLHVQYTPGTDIPVADTLSRVYLTKEPDPEIAEQDINLHVHSALHSLLVSAIKLEEFRTETAKDQTLRHLKCFIQHGPPPNKSLIPDVVKPYLTFLDEITEAQGNHIIVPSSMRKEMKARIHEGHLGIEQCKTRARECLFWPGMTSEIADIVSWCETCIQSGRKPLREPLIPLPLATLAWNRVACDLFHMNGRDYLLIVDYFTSYPEVTLLTETASSAIIGHTKSIFARHGIPDTVITDYGPQFTSTEYCDFAKQWEFKHTTSSPLHPRPNGNVKRTVRCVVTRRSLISQRTQAIFLLSSKFFFRRRSNFGSTFTD